MNMKVTDDQISQYVSKYSDAILMVPLAVQKAMLMVDRGYMDMCDDDLEKLYYPKEKTLNLRISFWEEYHLALKEERFMEMKHVYGKVCTQNYFFNIVLKSTIHMVWLFRPEKNHALDRETTLRNGLARLQEILELPLRNEETGKVDTATGNLILKTIKMLEDRVSGAVVNRHEHLNVNISPGKSLPKDIQELEAKIKALEVTVVTSGALTPEVLPRTFTPQASPSKT